ncbi:MAG TPA: DUF4136 domain-containing protein [Gemmatimonadaceae bacterium]|jgi:hypothetical protein|nr:DUF4136 domain-containing protein [Gemmatimonadaceae bacterium]
MLARRTPPRPVAWRTTALAVGLGMLTGIAACGDKLEVLSPLPVGSVTTFHDSSFNFTTLNTFAMPDTVVHLAPLTGTPLEVTRQFDQVALDQVRQNLLARGYVEDTIPGTMATFVVLVGATATTNYNAFVGYPWFNLWGFWPGWNEFTQGNFDTSWTIVYPWFGVVGTTAYDRGTLIVDLIPTLQVNPLDKSIKSAWAGVATAAVLDQNSITSSTVQAAIDQMFALSPYLVAGPVVTPHDRAP